jgi:intracellular sulfur oxidation DsrE/DsrF family protein
MREDFDPGLGNGRKAVTMMRMFSAAECALKPVRALPLLLLICMLATGVLTAGLIDVGSLPANKALTASSDRVANAPVWVNANEHRVVILIDSEDEKVMGHAISYAMNISRSFAQRNEKTQIEIVANGSGIKLFRADTSPLQQPLAFLREALPDVVFSMCDSSRHIAEQKEGHAIALIPGARLVPFGIGRVVELEEAGWSYVHG